MPVVTCSSVNTCHWEAKRGESQKILAAASVRQTYELCVGMGEGKNFYQQKPLVGPAGDGVDEDGAGGDPGCHDGGPERELEILFLHFEAPLTGGFIPVGPKESIMIMVSW